jgi:hypothetical protein
MDGEYSSILASALGFLPSPNHPIRSRQHVGWNGHADLLRSFQIDPKLKLHRLFHRQAGRFGSFQDPVDAICDSPVGFVAIKPPLASAGVRRLRRHHLPHSLGLVAKPSRMVGGGVEYRRGLEQLELTARCRFRRFRQQRFHLGFAYPAEGSRGFECLLENLPMSANSGRSEDIRSG